MIVRPKPGLFEILFAMRGSILPKVAGRLVLMALVGSGAVIAARNQPGIFAQITTTPFTLVGLALSIFMSFRNNACYDRWWEGRKQWGALVVAARSLARQLAGLGPAERRPLLLGVCGFAAGLAARLRGRDELAALGAWVDSAAPCPGPNPGPAPNPTDAALRQLGLAGQGLLAAGRLEPMRWLALEEQITRLAEVQAACERIATTPVPFAYSLLLHRTAHVFCLFLPLALAGPMGWWSLLPDILVAYTFFGLDALGDQLEEPFGTEANDLPIDAITRTIQREMLAAAGDSELPEPLVPQAAVLL